MIIPFSSLEEKDQIDVSSIGKDDDHVSQHFNNLVDFYRKDSQFLSRYLGLMDDILEYCKNI